MKRDEIGEYIYESLNELRLAMKKSGNSALDEFLIMPLKNNIHEFEEHYIKYRILKNLLSLKLINKEDCNYYESMLSIIYVNYYNLGKKITIEKIKDFKGDETVSKSIFKNETVLKYQEFEKKLESNVISIYKKSKSINGNISDSKILKYYILDQNKKFFNNLEISYIENAIKNDDFNNLNIDIEVESTRISNR